MTTIHTTSPARLRRLMTAMVLASFTVAQAVQACPGCKQAVGGDGAKGDHTINGAGVGYALSIVFLLFMIASTVGSIGYFAYRNCQALAAQHRAAMEGALPGGSRA